MAGVKSLNTRQKSFIELLLQGRTGLQAVREAGYSQKNSGDRYRELMAVSAVQAELERRRNELEVKTELSIERLKKMTFEIAENGKSDSVRLQAIDILNRIMGAYAIDNSQKAAFMPIQINIGTSGNPTDESN